MSCATTAHGWRPSAHTPTAHCLLSRVAILRTGTMNPTVVSSLVNPRALVHLQPRHRTSRPVAGFRRRDPWRLRTPRPQPPKVWASVLGQQGARTSHPLVFQHQRCQVLSCRAIGQHSTSRQSSAARTPWLPGSRSATPPWPRARRHRRTTGAGPVKQPTSFTSALLRSPTCTPSLARIATSSLPTSSSVVMAAYGWATSVWPRSSKDPCHWKMETSTA
mmetsp:Transcript_2360/g.5425  ORF Transcript_2360/g.5425 Transcript_2360/m.5425 type:complete len:219 (+) Transcript_2360:311-967(+)